MMERNYIPGPVKVMYAVYASALALVLYSGFCRFHPFVSGWRYPWSMALMNTFNFLMAWIMVLVAVVYVYYAALVRPKDWQEPLGIFRIIIGLLTIWFFLVVYATYQPFGWLNWLVVGVGGVARMWKIFELMLWCMMLLNMIYLYARWVKSERFPGLFAKKS